MPSRRSSRTFGPPAAVVATVPIARAARATTARARRVDRCIGSLLEGWICRSPVRSPEGKLVSDRPSHTATTDRPTRPSHARGALRLDQRPRRVTPSYPRLRTERGRGRSRKRTALIAILVVGLVGRHARASARSRRTRSAPAAVRALRRPRRPLPRRAAAAGPVDRADGGRDAQTRDAFARPDALTPAARQRRARTDARADPDADPARRGRRRHHQEPRRGVRP